MVYAERMRLVEGLYKGEFGLCGVVDVDRGAARSREKLCTCWGNGEDVAGLWVGRVDCVEGEVLFRLQAVSKEVATG
jgi:hypothetical protein